MSQRRRRAHAMQQRMLATARRKLAINLGYALWHGVLGVTTRSWWMLALFGYYAILGVTRFAAVLCARRSSEARFVARLSGSLLMLLSLALSGVIYVSMRQGLISGHGMISMIGIATYVFYKIVCESVRAVRQRRMASPLLATLRSIGYAEVTASVVTLQREMLATFGNMAPESARIMNALTGAAACAFIFLLGVGCRADSVSSRLLPR